MTPAQFIARWRDNPLSERAGSQPFFLDLCAMLGVEGPDAADHYCFERGAKKAGGGDGWADVWMRGGFGWENKRPGRSLGAAGRRPGRFDRHAGAGDRQAERGDHGAGEW